MEIGIDYRLEKVALKLTKDDKRVNLSHINIIEGHAVATDGVTLVYVPVTIGDGDVDGMISVESLMLARKAAKQAEEYAAIIQLGEVLTLDDGKTIPRPECDPFPQTAQFIDTAKNSVEEFRIALSPRALLKLSEAMDASTGVILHISKTTRNIFVTPNNESNKAHGILCRQTLPGEREGE